MNWGVCLILASLGLTFLYIADAQSLQCDQNNSQCCDTNNFCTFWSQRGECNRNPNWMLINCQVSCGTCGSSNRATLPPLPPTATLRPSIVNQTPSPTVPIVQKDPAVPAGCNAIQPMEVFTTQILSLNQFQQGVGRSGCGTRNRPRDCNRNICFHRKFRSMDGVCNNLGEPLLGAAFTPTTRLLPSAYDDKVNAVVSSLTRDRPNPRQVSLRLLGSPQFIALNSSSLLMQWAQFIAHDMSQNALGASCPCNTGSPHCANMPPVPGDPLRMQCSQFPRSTAECGTGFNGRPREQMNLNTAFLDGSAVYGSDVSTGRSLRSGFMLRFTGDFRRQMIPTTGQLALGGDIRTGIFSGLHALQTYFLRMHNRIATNLSQMNPRWTQDRVFEETRKIVGGIIQAITYQEFLPAFLGSSSNKIGQYSGYKAEVNPSVISEFSTAAFRLHGLLSNTYSLRDINYRTIGTWTFSQGIQNGNMQFVLSSLDSITRGLIATPAKSPQRLANSVADSQFNLATFSLQRGRDHGFPPYNAYRRLCGLGELSSFDSWPEVTDPLVIARVKELYPRGVNTLDLYVGGLLERPLSGSAVGPTFACIISEQFKRVRDGDRLFYENPGTFTQEQLIAIRRVTLAWVICAHADNMPLITRTAFFADAGSAAGSCNSLQHLDLASWQE